MPARFLDIMRPVSGVLPEISEPQKPLAFFEKCLWTFASLVVFLIGCQIPLFGVTTSKSADPLYWARVILASNNGTLMELGTSPIITSNMVMTLLAGAKLIDVDVSLAEDRQLFSTAQKLFGILITFGEAVAYVMTGAYGPVSEIGWFGAGLIVAQLVCSGLLVLMLDDLLQRGYGFGGGISLFMACNICEAILWKALSPVTINAGKGAEIEGALVATFAALMQKENKMEALRHAFFRDTAPNMMNMLATGIILLIVIYFQGFRIELDIGFQKMRGQVRQLPIKLFYTANIPIILQSALVSNLHYLSQLLYRRFPDSALVNVIGRWQEADRMHYVAVGGIAYFLTPPRRISDIISDPIHAATYILFVLSSCAMFAKIWVDVSGNSAKDLARTLRDQQAYFIQAPNSSIISVLEQYVSPAAALGGACIGALTLIADFMGAIGSGTGILLAVTILYGYYETLQKERNQEGSEMLK